MNTAVAPLFHAPSTDDAIDGLVAQYAIARANIEHIADLMSGPEMLAAYGYFVAGADHDRRYSTSPKGLFVADKAIKALDARYWDRAMELAGVMDYMPDGRRNEWRDSISKMATPPFTEADVRLTLKTLMAQRGEYLAEMVDEIFHGLSVEHVTNVPQGFGRRFIIEAVKGGYGSWECRKRGLIQSLRCVVAKILGREPPLAYSTDSLIRDQPSDGQWRWIDGHAFRMRLYLKGTAHLEIHEDLAWRLNQILSFKHPRAIPSTFREPRKASKRQKSVALIDNMLPPAVLRVLAACHKWDGNSGYSSAWGDADKHLRAQVEDVLVSIGGVYAGRRWEFAYNPADVIREIVSNGAIPDTASHQFYPTPDDIAADMVAWAEIGEDDQCLEPSAGLGAIAKHLPSDRTLCIEVSQLRCDVLKAQGFSVECADFLAWEASLRPSVVVMNPPYSEGRAFAHAHAALRLLAPGGRLLALLPATMIGKVSADGYSAEWREPRKFPGVSISVAILRVCKK